MVNVIQFFEVEKIGGSNNLHRFSSLFREQLTEWARVQYQHQYDFCYTEMIYQHMCSVSSWFYIQMKYWFLKVNLF